jgi:hypothetical protein
MISETEMSRKKIQGCALGLWDRQRIFGQDLRSTGNKSKNRQMELHQAEKILHFKENN